MLRLKANKTSLYNLVATYKPLPGMRRVDFQKANGRPDYWLEWTTDDGHTKAFLSSSLGCPILTITTHDAAGGQLYHEAHRLSVEGLRERGMVEETVAILGLLHDVCKAGVYNAETKRRRNPETGVWEDYLGYTFRDPLPLGHGEKSLYQIARFIRLEDHEALAIRWHMGAYDTAARTDLRDLSAAMDATPWVWRLHEADMCAAHIDERGTDE